MSQNATTTAPAAWRYRLQGAGDCWFVSITDPCGPNRAGAYNVQPLYASCQEAGTDTLRAARTEKYDDVLMPFLSLMRRELHANSRKGDRPGWLALDANTLLLEVYWHTAKLSAAVKNNDGPAIVEHSADVANMAMMVLDACGGLALVEAERTWA